MMVRTKNKDYYTLISFMEGDEVSSKVQQKIAGAFRNAISLVVFDFHLLTCLDHTAERTLKKIANWTIKFDKQGVMCCDDEELTEQIRKTGFGKDYPVFESIEEVHTELQITQTASALKSSSLLSGKEPPEDEEKNSQDDE